jgi:eukaryotic-like serine/threonine-protein kinase
MKERHQVGEIVRSRYCITEILGEGGLGITYAAEDLETVDRVALKALSFRQVNEWKVLELFEREAKILAQLDHPAIAKYLDYFQIDHDRDRDFYIVQELIEGKSLAQEIADGWHGSEADIKEIVEQVLHVLIYLHELKPPIIHRDIKPQNIILRPNGKIAIVDFGAVQDTYRNTQVGGSTVVGTYGYMPPEQFRGKAIPATDLYALGATVLFLLTGRSPADLPEVRFKINFRSSVNVSPNFANWLERMIEPAIEDRFSSAHEALKFLSGSLQISYDTLETLHNQAKKRELIDLNHINSKPLPLDSLIKFKRTYDLLEIEIPSINSNYWRWKEHGPIWLITSYIKEGLALLMLSFFACLFTVPLISAILLYLGAFPSLSYLPYLIAGLIVTYCKIAAFIKCRIVIGEHNFKIDWEIFKFKFKRSKKGKTQDLNYAELTVSERTGSEGDKIIKREFGLHQGVYVHKIGEHLSRAEKEWLAQEINGFLEMLRSRQ